MIQIKDISFSYPRQALFHGLSAKLEPGKIYGLLGKNGSGKTTLLKLIMGNLNVDRGSIIIDNQSSWNRKADTLASVFFLPEEYYLAPLSIQDFIKANASFYPNFNHDQFWDILKQFEVDTNRKIPQLSFGNKKKFQIAFAIACNPTYLLLDEPSNGLDIPSKRIFRQILAKEIKDHQCVLISTHQVRDLAPLMESVIIINDGTIMLAKDIIEIENKLLFSQSQHSTLEDSLYAEQSPGGFAHILPNPDREISEVSLELLFNGINEYPERIMKTFKS